MKISDEGVGMSQSNLNKIFRLDNDYLTIGTAQEKGAGIGLLLCKEYVVKNGGKFGPIVRKEKEVASTSQFPKPINLWERQLT